jgi:hypothetical protein
MGLMHRMSADERWARDHPWGEPESVDYWVEVMKRAVQLGEARAQGEIGKLLALTGPQPPRSYLDFPDWFWHLWSGHLAPYSHERLSMPY